MALSWRSWQADCCSISVDASPALFSKLFHSRTWTPCRILGKSMGVVAVFFRRQVSRSWKQTCHLLRNGGLFLSFCLCDPATIRWIKTEVTIELMPGLWCSRVVLDVPPVEIKRPSRIVLDKVIWKRMCSGDLLLFAAKGTKRDG